jgi:hypothetical protein
LEKREEKMSRDADKYKYRKKGDIDRRSNKRERRKIWNERFEGKKNA